MIMENQKEEDRRAWLMLRVGMVVVVRYLGCRGMAERARRQGPEGQRVRGRITKRGVTYLYVENEIPHLTAQLNKELHLQLRPTKKVKEKERK